jgi:hypothetical protein
VRRLAFVVLLIAICLPGLLGANAWLENSDVDRYVEMARGEVGEIPFRYRPTVPWLASLLAFPAVTSLRLVSLACTLGAYLCVDRIVSLLGGDRTRAGWLFAASFPVAAYGASGYIDAAVLLVLAAGTWAVLTRSWRVFAAILVVGAGEDVLDVGAVGVDEADSVAVVDVLDDHILQEHGLSGTGLSDHVHVAHAVISPKDDGCFLATVRIGTKDNA